MKRVLIVATSRKTRGGITAVLKAWESQPVWKNYHCHWVQTHRDGPAWRKIFYFARGLAGFLVRLPFYDTVHIHTADHSTEKRKRIFARLAKTFGKKLIIHLHSSGEEYSIGKYPDLYSYSFRHADKIILLSESWRDIAKKAFPDCANKFEILYNPCHHEVRSSELSEREPYILFAGTLTHRKGYDDLITAFSKIADRHPEWELVLAGNGEIERARELAAKYHLEGRISLPGWINGADKDRAFRKASAYCLPSYSEGFPMGVLDAWAYHLPVITTPVGGIPEVGIDEENMLLFKPGDVDALAERLNRLISDKELYSKLTQASADFADGQFNIAKIMERLSSIYESI